MTCIVGLKFQGKVYIGGDSAGVSGMDLMVRADQKVFRNGRFLMGFTSSFRMGQLLRYCFAPPEQSESADDYQFMVAGFVRGVRECLKEGGFAEKEKERETGGTFIVGYRGELYTVADDYQVAMNVCGYEAVGCGASYALGSLFSSRGDPKKRVLESLHAAERFSAGVRHPFIVRHL